MSIEKRDAEKVAREKAEKIVSNFCRTGKLVILTDDITSALNSFADEKLIIVITGLEAIKKHVELYLKGDLTLSTTWNIANQTLEKLKSGGR